MKIKVMLEHTEITEDMEIQLEQVDSRFYYPGHTDGKLNELTIEEIKEQVKNGVYRAYSWIRLKKRLSLKA